MKELCFLDASGGNAFMTELLEAVAGAVADEGVPVSFQADRYPPFRDGVVYVVIPHEFFELAPGGGEPTPAQLRRTVGLCVELPGTTWFAASCRHAPRLGAVVDIREGTARQLRMAGIPCTHAPLGYTEAWDHWHRDESAVRPLDVTYMGSTEGLRDEQLAGYAPTLAGRETRLLIAPAKPKPAASPSFLLGPEKFELLRSSKTLLNLHREHAEALEWPRVLQAICNGCVVVTERSVDMAPLVPGEHLVAGRPASLAALAEFLIEDPDELRRLRLGAYDFVRAELPMSTGAQRLIEVAEGLARTRLRPQTAAPVPDPPGPDPLEAAAEMVEDAILPVQRAIKRVLLETREARRAEARAAAGDARVEVVSATSAYASAEPRVTVAISLHNYESEVGAAMRSVAGSDYEDYELLVLDDASTDDSAGAVQRFMRDHDWLPASLLRHTANEGLAGTRNTLTAHARGELVFVLDADNGVYPQALGRLVAALDADPGAAFAYPMIAAHDDRGPVWVLSRFGWDPELLVEDNFVDAMALIRRRALVDVGGYCADPRLGGWEDYDLWCQFAERGWRGVQVPELLAWYRRSGHSMLSTSASDFVEARSVIAARAPEVFVGGAV